MTQLLVADACTLLNLTATGREVEVVKAAEVVLLVPEMARGEVRYHTIPDHEGRASTSPVDLTPMERAGVLKIVPLSAGYLDAFVDCCVHLQDVDASVLALAVHRRLGLTTDDRRIRKIAEEHYRPISIGSSLNLLRTASERLKWNAESTREILSHVLVRANFLPPRGDDDLTNWYRQHTAGVSLLRNPAS